MATYYSLHRNRLQQYSRIYYQQHKESIKQRRINRKKGINIPRKKNILPLTNDENKLPPVKIFRNITVSFD